MPGGKQLNDWLVQERPDWVHFHSFSTGASIPQLECAKATGARALATNHLASLGFLCLRGTLMRWGERMCDGICETVKCSECVLQSRGMPKAAARLTARITASIGAITLPGRVGSAIAIPQLVRFNRSRQQRMLELVEKFVVLNDFAANALIANGARADKIVLNRLGIATNMLSRRGTSATRKINHPVRVGYLGRINELKGVMTLAQAFASLPRDLNIRLEFRGPTVGPIESGLADEVQNMFTRDPRAQLLQPVRPEEVGDVLANYDVLCVPSIWFENGPTVMLEAMAVGTPVLGSRIGAMAEVIRHDVDGFLVTPGNVAQLADALTMIARDPTGTIDRWRAELRSPRTMDDVAADYLKLYES